MTEPTHETDLTAEELIERMDEVIRSNPGAKTFVKWTCPACGERVTATEYNTFRTGGYKHEERRDGQVCGYLYTGPLWGFMAMFSGEVEKLVKRGEA